MADGSRLCRETSRSELNRYDHPTRASEQAHTSAYPSFTIITNSEFMLRHLRIILCLVLGAISTTGLAQSYTISGLVLDAESKETLIGATIYAHELQQGVYTNVHGLYSLTLSKPITQLRVSYVGYETMVLNVEPKSQELRIELRPSGMLQEVVVSTDSKRIRQPFSGALEVPVHIIKTTPALLGENDLMKSLQMMPGVKSGSDGSAGVHVRGGGSDENLILLDGTPLYNVDHLLGFFSVFTPEAVKRVDLYKGSFPARYGGRLSSVIDVRTNDGNMQRYHGTLGIGLLSAKAHIEGPIIKDKTSILITGRRSYLDALAQPFLDEGKSGGYYFYDVNAKVQHRFNDRSRLHLGLYKGRDRLHLAQTDLQQSMKMGIDWGNTLGTLRWNHAFSPRFVSDLTLAYTDYNFDMSGEFSDRDSQGRLNQGRMSYLSGITDLSLAWAGQYTLTPHQELRFGLDAIHHQFKPETYGVNGSGDYAPSPEVLEQLKKHNRSIQANEGSAYIESRTELGRLLTLNLGLRGTIFEVDNKRYTSLQPRADVDVRMSESLSAHAAYAHMVQNVHLLTSATMALPTDLWVPTTGHIRPMTSDQVSLGVKYHLGRGWTLSADGYYKAMTNVLEYKDGASMLGNSLGWESKVEMGRGRAYGVEFMLMKSTGRTTGWVGYTLARSERQFPNGTINAGEWFPYKYDRRHYISLVVNHQLSKVVELSASWEFYTGAALTVATEQMHILTPDDLHQFGTYLSGRNNYRMPSTHRLNLSANFHMRLGRTMKSVLNVSVFNAYNQQNPSFIFPEDFFGGASSGKLTEVTLLPIIPSINYSIKF